MWIGQQHPLAGKIHLLQASSDGASPSINLRVGQDDIIRPAAEQINECLLIRMFLGVVTQHANQIVRKLLSAALRCRPDGSQKSAQNW